jgi:hypothetical protein
VLPIFCSASDILPGKLDNAVTGLALIGMQPSYQESVIAEELEKFLRISGMSRTLFTNRA